MDPSEEPTLAALLAEERWLRALGRRLVRDAATADDLAQETWLRALRSRPDVAHTVTSPRSWLARLMLNVWREGGRSEGARRRREGQVARHDTAPSAQEALEHLELQQRLAAHVLALPEPFRSTLVLRYFAGRSAAEIAAEADEPSARVRQRLVRARALLREQLDREGEPWLPRFAVLLLPTSPAVHPGPPTATGPSWSPLAPAGLSLFAVSTKSVAVALVLATALLVTLSTLQRTGSSATPLDAPDDVVSLERTEAGSTLDATETVSVAQAAATRLPALELLALGAERPDRPASVVGSVHASEDGRPLFGAEVALLQGGFDEPQHTTRTDAEGAYTFGDVSPGRYDVAARMNDRVPRIVVDLDVVLGAELQQDLTLERGFAPELLVTERESGAPVAGAEVTLVAGSLDAAVWIAERAYAYHGLTCTTDAAGRANPFGASPGVYQYIVRAEGHPNTLGEALLAPDGAPLHIALERGGAVTGVVRDHAGATVEGVVVLLVASQYEKRLEAHVLTQNGVTTDATGRYHIGAVPGGAYRAVALRADGSGTFAFDAADGAQSSLASVFVDRGAEVTLDFALPVPGRVSARVVDTDGRPIVGAHVSVSWGDFKPGSAPFFDLARVPGLKERIHHRTESDAEGQFVLAPLRLSWRPLEVTVTCPGYAKVELSLAVNAGEHREETVVLRALDGTICGRVVAHDGAPLAGRSVSAFEQDGERLGAYFGAVTNEDGFYEVRVARHEGTNVRYRVAPFLRDHEGLSAEPKARNGVSIGAHEVDFVLAPRTLLAGQVVDEGGAVVRDFVVHVRRAGRGLLGHVEGRWDLLRDAHTGEGRFKTFVDGLDSELCWSAPGHDAVFVTAREVVSAERVVLTRARDLEGVILDAWGAPVAEAVVALATLDSAVYPAGTGFAPRAVTDSGGRFRLVGVPATSTAGPSRLTGQLVVCPGREDLPPLVRVPLPRERSVVLRITLPRASPKHLLFEDDAGRPATGFALVLDSEGWPLEPALEKHIAHLESERRGWLRGGRAEFALAPGTYAVVLVDGAEVLGRYAFDVALDGTGAAVHTFVVNRDR